MISESVAEKSSVTPRVESKLDPTRALHREVIPAGEPWVHEIARGQRLRIVDLDGNQAVDTLFYNAHDYSDRYSAQDTIRQQANIYLTTGTKLISTAGRTRVHPVGVRPLISAVSRSCSLRNQPRVLVVVDVGTIERDVVLIAPGAEDFAVGGHAGLQAQQFDDVACLKRKLANLCFPERISHAGTGRIDLRGFGSDVDDLARCAQ